MTTKLDMKITDKVTRMLCSVLVMMAVTGIVLLAPQVQVAVMAADVNATPVAVISGTLMVYLGATVYLDATGSYDPGGNALNYRWKSVCSPECIPVIISDSSSAQASFTPTEIGVYWVELIVNNGFADSKPAYASITVIQRPYMW
jgi:hypothetical protein